MGGRQKFALVAAALAVLAGLMVKVLSITSRPLSLQGAVIQQAGDPREQLPIAGAEISVASGLAATAAKSNSSGFFKIAFLRGTRAGERVPLRIRHPDYQPLDMNWTVGDEICIVRLASIHQSRKPGSSEVMITNVLVRYSSETSTLSNIGSAVKTFEVVNAGDIPCQNRPPCSPDGKWKASVGGSSTLDAGEDNEFRDARVSCIAGPCPFTKIEAGGFSKGGRYISAVARNWSDTTTFLLQAEVFHRSIGNMIQNAHPVIFGRALDFTLPAAAQGPSLEAELNGMPMVFPLEPNASLSSLSWATCEARTDKDQSVLYRCELKQGYRFR